MDNDATKANPQGIIPILKYLDLRQYCEVKKNKWKSNPMSNMSKSNKWLPNWVDEMWVKKLFPNWVLDEWNKCPDGTPSEWKNPNGDYKLYENPNGDYSIMSKEPNWDSKLIRCCKRTNWLHVNSDSIGEGILSKEVVPKRDQCVLRIL